VWSVQCAVGTHGMHPILDASLNSRQKNSPEADPYTHLKHRHIRPRSACRPQRNASIPAPGCPPQSAAEGVTRRARLFGDIFESRRSRFVKSRRSRFVKARISRGFCQGCISRQFCQGRGAQKESRIRSMRDSDECSILGVVRGEIGADRRAFVIVIVEANRIVAEMHRAEREVKREHREAVARVRVIVAFSDVDHDRFEQIASAVECVVIEREMGRGRESSDRRGDQSSCCASRRACHHHRRQAHRWR
jgi:hypothetical protein